MDIVALPLLAAVLRNRKVILRLLGLLAIMHVGRAFLMSERVAIVEVVCVAWIVLPLCGVKGIPIRKGAIGGALVVILFSMLLSARLDQQSQAGGRFDSTATGILDSVWAYYSDTMNKYYQVASGDFEYPGVFALAPVGALLGWEGARALDYKSLLEQLESSSSMINSGLNNPGGLAQDVSDFGILGYFVIILKFLIMSYIWKRRFSSLVCLALAPLILISILEYPRFNYLSMPFAAYLLVFSVVIGFVVKRAAVRREVDAARFELSQKGEGAA